MNNISVGTEKKNSGLRDKKYSPFTSTMWFYLCFDKNRNFRSVSKKIYQETALELSIDIIIAEPHSHIGKKRKPMSC